MTTLECEHTSNAKNEFVKPQIFFGLFLISRKAMEYTTRKILPRIVSQPETVTVDAGETAVFTVKANGATAYRWQYQKPGSSTWTNVSSNGASATYTLTTAARHNGYTYRCKVTNAAGSVYTKAVTLTVK